MRLLLELPASWARRTDGDEQVATVPGSSTEPPLVLTSSKLIWLPDEQRSWVDRTLRQATPAGARIEVTSNVTGETTDGWPVRLVEAIVRPADNAAPLEWRMVAFYAFFEHAATAMVRATSEAGFREQHDQLRGVLLGGSPDWSGAPVSLHELWDVTTDGESRRVAAPKLALEALHQRRVDVGLGEAVDRTLLAELDALLATGATVERHTARGGALQRLGESGPALAAFRAALALDANHAPAHAGIASILAAQGDERGAMAAWLAAGAADPREVDALYNAGLAAYKLRDFAGASDAWQRALARSPRDFWIARKLIQAQYALGKLEDAAVTRALLLEIWRTTSEPSITIQDELVFDQFAVGDLVVYAAETLRPRDPTSYPIYTFRVVERGSSTAPLQVAIETSDYAKSRGVPFVISLLDGASYRALGTASSLPPYPELKASVEKLIGDASAARSKR